MAQEIEIEFKSMLTKNEFERLLRQLAFPEQPIVQTNHYFETEHFSLKKHQSALRIREKHGQFTLTLKEPHPVGILETHDRMSREDAGLWLQGKPISQPNVAKQLRKIGVSENDLQYYGSLMTERFFYQDDNGIEYMLDKSSYHDRVDYELEIESKTRKAGLNALHTLLQKYDIVERKAQPKIARFFAAAI